MTHCTLFTYGIGTRMTTGNAHITNIIIIISKLFDIIVT